jgi:hypothetical protein
MNLIALTYGPVLFAIMVATIYSEIRDIRSASSSRDTVSSAKMSLFLSIIFIVAISFTLSANIVG